MAALEKCRLPDEVLDSIEAKSLKVKKKKANEPIEKDDEITDEQIG